MNGPFDELAKVAAACVRPLQYVVDGLHSAMLAPRSAEIDVGDRRPADKPRHVRELSLQLIAQSIPAPIAVMTPSGEVEVVNQPVLEYFGKTLDELKGWRTADAVHPDDLPHVVAVWTEAIQNGRRYEVESRHRRADGVYR